MLRAAVLATQTPRASAAEWQQRRALRPGPTADPSTPSARPVSIIFKCRGSPASQPWASGEKSTSQDGI